MSAAVAQAPFESRMPVDREAIAFVLAGWSGCSVEHAGAMLPPNLDREVVRAQAASWLEDLALRPTAERIDALVMMGVRRASFGRTRLNRSL
jgi:hypothetical protein